MDLGERAAAVQPAALGGGLDGGVLAAHLVGADRHVEAGAGGGQDVQRGHRRLDQQHVRALGDVGVHLAHGLAAVRRVHLVAAPVAERRAWSRRRRGTGRRTRRRSWRRRRGSRCPGGRRVQARADRGDLAVHHPAGGDDVRAGLGLARGRPGEQLDGGVVVHPAVGEERAAVAVVRVLAQAGVGDQDEVEVRVAEPAQRLLDDAVRDPAAGPDGVLVGRQAEQDHAADAERGERAGVHERLVRGHALHAGHGADGLATLAARAGRTAARPAGAGGSGSRARTRAGSRSGGCGAGGGRGPDGRSRRGPRVRLTGSSGGRRGRGRVGGVVGGGSGGWRAEGRGR